MHTAHVHQDTAQEDRWVLALREGDAEAFSALFTAYYGELVSYATSIVFDRVVAEDVIQDVFLGLWARRAAGVAPGKIAYYLYRAVRHRALNAIRGDRRATRAKAAAADMMTGTAFPALGTTTLEANEFAVTIARAVTALPERCREVFLLSRFRRLSQKEIAELLGITLNTVNTQLARALRAIRLAVHASMAEEGGQTPTPQHRSQK